MTTDWKQLSEAASREPDPEKLLEIVDQLDKALEQCENDLKEKKRISELPSEHKSSLYPISPVRNIRPLSA